MNISRFNRVTHRDIGYLVAGLTIIYSLSGIALNHKHDWNPNYIVESQTFNITQPVSRQTMSDEAARNILKDIPGNPMFKAWYFPSGNILTIFVEGGSVRINTGNSTGVLERLIRRPLFYQLNFLHYNPGHWWKYFSDIFCIALIIVVITGLFIVKGKNGITKRGAILTITGVILPLIFLFIY